MDSEQSLCRPCNYLYVVQNSAKGQQLLYAAVASDCYTVGLSVAHTISSFATRHTPGASWQRSFKPGHAGMAFILLGFATRHTPGASLQRSFKPGHAGMAFILLGSRSHRTNDQKSVLSQRNTVRQIRIALWLIQESRFAEVLVCSNKRKSAMMHATGKYKFGAFGNACGKQVCLKILSTLATHLLSCAV